MSVNRTVSHILIISLNEKLRDEMFQRCVYHSHPTYETEKLSKETFRDNDALSYQEMHGPVIIRSTWTAKSAVDGRDKEY